MGEIGFVGKSLDPGYRARVGVIAQFLNAKKSREIRSIGLGDQALTQMF